LLAPGRAVLMQESDPNALYGIGAVLIIQNAAATVEELAPGGAAAKDGQLKPGDVITAVAQANGPYVDCSALPLDKIVAMIRGKKGTTVRLKVMSAGVPKTINLVRSEIKQAEIGVGAAQLQVRAAAGALQVQVNQVAAAATVDAEPKNPLQKLSPGDAALLEDFLKTAGAAIRAKQSVQMKQKVDEIAAATGMGDAGKKTLLDAIAPALDQIGPKTHDAILDLMRGGFQSVPAGQMHQVLEQISSAAPMVAKEYQMQTAVWPADAPAWQAALKKALTPAEAAAWDAAQANHKKDVEAQIADFLATIGVGATRLAHQQLDPEANAIRTAVNLQADRLASLNALEASAAADFAKSIQARFEKAMLEMPDADRKDALKANENDFPPTMALDEWKAGVAKILTPEELSGMKSAKEDRASIRERAAGRVMLALMDERVALTSAQRRQLEPLTWEMMKNSSEIIASADANENDSIQLSQLLAAGTGTADDKVKAILDANQWQHWQDAAAGKNVNENVYEEQTLPLPALNASSAPTPRPEADPDAVEKAISRYMADKSKAEREKILAQKQLKAEDAARTLHLGPDAAQRLTTAACGAADAYMTGWSNTAEQVVRSTIASANADTINQRLQCIQGYQFEQAEQNAASGTPQDSVWDETVKNLLNPQQVKTWKAETDARQQYLSDAVCGWITVAFSQQFALSPDQEAKLRPMIAKIFKKYGDRFGGYFTGETPWFLQGYYMFMPVAGIDEKELATVLTKDQVDRWNGSEVHGQAAMYWQNIRN
jgi:hypothetical protein